MEKDAVIVPCAKCGTKNRVPKDRLYDKPVCGKCRTLLPLNVYFNKPFDVTDGSFNHEVLSSQIPVLVDCWAPWCGPCRMVAPIVDQLAAEYAGRIKIAKLNVDENPLTASKFETRSIPTLLLFKNGKLVNRLVGALPREAIEKELIPLINKS